MDRKEAIDVMQNNLEWGECYDFEEAATVAITSMKQLDDLIDYMQGLLVQEVNGETLSDIGKGVDMVLNHLLEYETE